MNHNTGPRIRVAVRITDDMSTARIAVHGVLTPMNLRALAVIARRTIALLPGREIVLDLSKSRAAAATLEELHAPGQLVGPAGDGHNTARPCTLRVLNPMTVPAA